MRRKEAQRLIQSDECEHYGVSVTLERNAVLRILRDVPADKRVQAIADLIKYHTASTEQLLLDGVTRYIEAFNILNPETKR